MFRPTPSQELLAILLPLWKIFSSSNPKQNPKPNKKDFKRKEVILTSLIIIKILKPLKVIATIMENLNLISQRRKMMIIMEKEFMT